MSEAADVSDMHLFEGVHFCPLGTLDKELKDILLKGKAKAITYLSDMVTHAIVSDPTHHEVEVAQEVFQIPTVKPAWIKMSMLCKKLLPTNAFIPSLDQLFSNIVACFSNIPNEDKHTLWALITYYGGMCQSVLNGKCTHLVTPFPTGKKYDAAVKYDSIKVVAPDWVIDCVKKKELQPCDDYNPELNIIPKEPTPPPPIKLDSNTVETIKNLSVEDAVAAKGLEDAEMQKVGEVSSSQTKSTFEGTSHKHTVSESTSALSQLMESPKFNTQIRHAAPQFQIMNNLPRSSFAVPNAVQMRPLQSTAGLPMSTASGQHAGMILPNQQVLPILSTSNHQVSTGIMLQEQQQRAIASSSYVAVSPGAGRSTVGSPRKSSSQSSGGKKKKSSGAVGSRPTSMSIHSPIRQVHPQFQTPVAGIFATQSQQQQQQQQQQMMMAKLRMTGNMESTIESPINPAQMVGPRFGITGAQGRFLSPGMLSQHEEGAQHLHQHQIMQQQMQRVRQAPPGNVQVINPMDSMQAKWPQQQQQQFYAHVQQANISTDDAQALQQPVLSQMQQGVTKSMQQNTSPSRQHYNSAALINRFPNQMTPQPQQMFYQHQLHPQHRNQVPRFPTTNSLEAAGMSGISPIALQQGLLNAEKMQADNPPLVHPSLQGMSPKASGSSQNPGGSSSQKKRTKSRKKTDTTDEEGKSRPRQRNAKPKKPPTPSHPVTPVLNKTPNINQMPTPNAVTPPQFNFDGRSLSPARTPSNFPGMQPTSHAQFAPTNFPMRQPTPQAFSTAVHQPSTKAEPVPHSNFPQKNHQEAYISNLTPPQPIQKPLDKKEKFLPVSEMPRPVEKMEVEPTVPTRNFVDPLTFKVKELENDYVTRLASDTVPECLFLLGCVFHIVEYSEIVSDIAVIELWKTIIEKFGGIVEKQYTQACTHLLCATCASEFFKAALLEGKRCVTVYWLNDVLLLKRLRVPWLALHVPTQFGIKNKPAIDKSLCCTNFHIKERERLKMMGFVCGAKFTGYLSRTHTALICKEKIGLKYEKSSSWSIPSVNGLWLRDMVLGDGTCIDFSQEKYQRVLSVHETVECFLLIIPKALILLNSWKVPIHVTQDCLSRAGIQHRFEPLPLSPSEPKRLKQDLIHHPFPRICFTGIPPSLVQELRKKVESLNGKIETRYALCTHLVAKSISRTVKFLCCISSCSHVVTPAWIEDSFKNGCFLSESNYHVVDKVTEAKFQFSLDESVRRAKKAPLFKDFLFCISSSVTPEAKTLKQIIECAGGRVLNKIPNLTVLKHMKARTTPDRSIIIISCPDDESVYNPLKKEGLPVHNAEIVLTGVLKHEVDLESYRL